MYLREKNKKISKFGNASLIVVTSAVVLFLGLVSAVLLKKEQVEEQSTRPPEQLPMVSIDTNKGYYEFPQGPSLTVTPGTSVTINVNITTGGGDVTGAGMVVKYDNTDFDFVSDSIVQIGSAMGYTADNGTVPGDSTMSLRVGSQFVMSGSLNIPANTPTSFYSITLTPKTSPSGGTYSPISFYPQDTGNFLINFGTTNGVDQSLADSNKTSVSFSTGVLPSPSPSTPPVSECSTNDLDGDGYIDLGDLLEAIRNWDNDSWPKLIYILRHWGQQC